MLALLYIHVNFAHLAPINLQIFNNRFQKFRKCCAGPRLPSIKLYIIGKMVLICIHRHVLGNAADRVFILRVGLQMVNIILYFGKVGQDLLWFFLLASLWVLIAGCFFFLLSLTARDRAWWRYSDLRCRVGSYHGFLTCSSTSEILCLIYLKLQAQLRRRWIVLVIIQVL